MIAHSCKLADPGLRYPKLQILELLYFGFTRKKSFSRKKSVDLGINFGEKDDITTTNFRKSQLINDFLPPPPYSLLINKKEETSVQKLSKNIVNYATYRSLNLLAGRFSYQDLIGRNEVRVLENLIMMTK